jgi:hypothetical protein
MDFLIPVSLSRAVSSPPIVPFISHSSQISLNLAMDSSISHGSLQTLRPRWLHQFLLFASSIWQPHRRPCPLQDPSQQCLHQSELSGCNTIRPAGCKYYLSLSTLNPCAMPNLLYISLSCWFPLYDL